MNHPVMPHKFTTLFAALLIAGCNAPSPAQQEAEPPLAGATIGGDFTLTGEDGQPVSWRDFDGQYRIIYFGYAFCPDVCPMDMQRSMAGLKGFEAENPELGAQIQPLFVTIDPARDTPEVVKEFTANFHPRLIGLTGSEQAVKEVADKFAVFYTRGDDSPSGGYLMDHSNITYLFGPKGEPLAILPTDEGPEGVKAELEKWVR